MHPRRKGDPKAGKSVRNNTVPIVRNFTKNTRLYNDSIYSEYLTQTQKSYLMATLVSMNPYESCLVHSVGHVFLVSLIFIILPPLLPQGSLSLRKRDQMEISNLSFLSS